MFKDSISASVKLEDGDVVYFYEYKDRKNINEFNDLQKAVITKVIPGQANDGNPMVEVNVPFIENNRVKYNTVVGFVVYKKQEDFVMTSEGLKYVSYYIKNNIVKLCLKKVKDTNALYSKLFVVMNIGKLFNIKFNAFEDIIFFNDKEIEQLSTFISIKKGELYDGYIKCELSGDTKEIFNYEFWKGDCCYYTDSDKHDLFVYACTHFSSKNKTSFGQNYEKIFSLKHTGFEIIDY